MSLPLPSYLFLNYNDLKCLNEKSHIPKIGERQVDDGSIFEWRLGEFWVKAREVLISTVKEQEEMDFVLY